MSSFTDGTDNLDCLLEGLQKLVDTTDDPVEQNRIRVQIKILEERLAWKLIQTWPGLFELYQHPDGSWKVEFDEALEQRRRRLEEGVTTENREVNLCLEALESIMALNVFCPPNGISEKNDIPWPEASNNSLGSNVLEIHEAALRLFRNTIMAVIVTNKIQQTLSSRVRALSEGSAQERRETAKNLKKGLTRAIDILAGVSSGAIAHGNKPLFKDTESNLKLLSVIAIDTAKNMVKEGKKLPTKFALRERIKQDLPNVVCGNRKWPEIIKEAGLDKLPNKVPFLVKT